MARREVHAAAFVDDRALKRFGQLDQARHCSGRARHPVREDHRGLRIGQQARRLGDGAGIADRGHDAREFRDAQPAPILDGVLLQLAVQRQQHRPHRRSHRDLAGAHRGLGKMLQRGRLVVDLAT